MNRSKVVSLQLGALALLIALLCYRVVAGGDALDGVVTLSSLEAHHLHYEAFALAQPAVLEVEATGSYDRASGTPTLAAYAWIVRRDDRSVAWRMGPENTVPGRGTLAHAQDSLVLKEGVYDVYFASYGNSFYTERDRSFFRRVMDPDQHWQNDRGKWNLILRSAEGRQVEVRSLTREERETSAPRGEGLIWTSAPMTNSEEAEHLFEVQRPTRLRLYAVGEFNGSAKDYAWIENAATETRAWEMTRENTTPAGGAAENRRFDGTLELGPGLYRAVYRTDRTHAYHGWRANPPLDPVAWGMTLQAADPADSTVVTIFDPWSMRTPIVRITEVRDDHLERAQFVVHRPTRLVVYAVGEIMHTNLYDYAWIERDDTKERIWEMTEKGSRPAGGDRKNRLVTDFVMLEPGTYTVYYQTDDSHAYGDWNADAPDHPERWGVALFPLEPRLPEDAVTILQVRRSVGATEEKEAAYAPPPPPPPGAAGETLLEHLQLGNEAHVEEQFLLEKPTLLHIYAVGEISARGKYDHGWIERAGSGETVWDMNWQNTQPAGGDDKNRIFDGTVRLGPGRYIVHFRTDFSHAFGDFGDAQPRKADAWGIAIRQVE